MVSGLQVTGTCKDGSSDAAFPLPDRGTISRGRAEQRRIVVVNFGIDDRWTGNSPSVYAGIRSVPVSDSGKELFNI